MVLLSSVQRIKAMVALMLALVWAPAVSCCVVEASGLLGKRDCCSKKHTHSVPGPGNCDKPCGALASASYLPQESQLFVIAPVAVPLFDCADILSDIQPASRVGRELHATAPPDLPDPWQFSLRMALSPRAPSFVL